MNEYPTLTALMKDREPGSVKVRHPEWAPSVIFRPGSQSADGDDNLWNGLNEHGHAVVYYNDAGPWLLVSEDAPALDTLRLEIAARVLAGLFSSQLSSLPCELLENHGGSWDSRHAWALAEADALIKEAMK